MTPAFTDPTGAQRATLTTCVRLLEPFVPLLNGGDVALWTNSITSALPMLENCCQYSLAACEIWQHSLHLPGIRLLEI